MAQALKEPVNPDLAAFHAGAALRGPSSFACLSMPRPRFAFVRRALREVRPPFSPEQVCADFATLLTSYGICTTTADRFAGEFPVEQMRKHYVTVTPSERSKSDIYIEFLSLLNSGNVELLDVPRLHAQLAGLERRTARGGRDSIDHAPGGHDDLANAACGALVEAFIPVSRA